MVFHERLENGLRRVVGERGNAAAAVAAPSAPGAPDARRNAGRFAMFGAAFGLLALHVVSLLPALTPSLRDIGDWDESWYVYWGYRLHQLHHPGLSANPIVGALYALIYPFVEGADLWLVEACRLGRAVFCVASWLVLLLVVRECCAQRGSNSPPAGAPPGWAWITPVLLFSASAVPAHLLATPNYQWGNPSDATFSIISGLAFWQILRFHERGDQRALAVCSGLLGVSVLARVDGLVLSAVVLGTVLALNSRNGRLRSVALPALTPFALVVGTFLALYAAVTGSLEQGISSRSYQAFEEGQAALRMSIADWKDYQLHTRPLAFDGDLSEVRTLFGTSEDNSGSVVRALLHHPSAAVDRLTRTLASIPAQVAAAYGHLVLAPLLALGLRGIVDLFARRRFGVLAAAACWVLPLGSYLLIFYRPGYFVLPFFVPFALATLGLSALARQSSRLDRYCELALAASGVGAVVVGAPWLAIGCALALGMFLLARRARDGRLTGRRAFSTVSIAGASLAALVTFAVGRVDGRPLGNGAEERAIRILRARLPAGAQIGAFGPGPVWTANPTFDLVSFESPDGTRVATRLTLERWLAENRVSAVYVNRALAFGFPASTSVLSSAIGEVFDVGFEDAESGVRVLFTRPEFVSRDVN